jgi:hypothetical protein
MKPKPYRSFGNFASTAAEVPWLGVDRRTEEVRSRTTLREIDMNYHVSLVSKARFDHWFAWRASRELGSRKSDRDADGFVESQLDTLTTARQNSGPSRRELKSRA